MTRDEKAGAGDHRPTAARPVQTEGPAPVDETTSRAAHEGVLERILLAAVPMLAVIYLSGLPVRLGYSVWRQQFVVVVAAAAIGAIFVRVATGRRGFRRALYAGAAAIAVVTLLGTAILWPELVGGNIETWNLIVGAMIILLVLEASRHTIGRILFALGLGSLAYGAISNWMPGRLRANINWERLVSYLYTDASGVFGSPITVTASVVLAFILFGAVLMAIGGGDVFVELALAVVGKRRGGSAKAAVVASSLFGSVSGSAVSNVVTTGNLTIPLMKRTGYPPHVAGAIEAVASTCGQLLPPVMGITAFLIADFLALPYTTVAIAAIAPALLVYLYLLMQANLEGDKAGAMLSNEEQAALPGLSAIARRVWILIVPLGAVVYALFFAHLPAGRAALYATGVAVLCGALGNHRRLRPSWFVEVFVDAGRKTVDLVVITAVAGLIIGVLSLTGLAFNMTGLIGTLSGDSLFVLLVITGLVALVLGMGMPTVGVYVLLAVTAAPAVVAAGVPPLAAHFFILYYGMLSMVTPPICLAAFAAAPLAEADPMRTGFVSARLSVPVYLVPFVFVYSPALLFNGDDWTTGLLVFTTAGLGLMAVAVAMSGYWRRALAVADRCVAGAVGLLLLWPTAGTLGVPTALAINALLVSVLAGLLRYRGRHRSGLAPARASVAASSSEAKHV